jgi:hypothetical protein
LISIFIGVNVAVIVLWEASDRVCDKRQMALLPILLPALERQGHLNLDATIRAKVPAMRAATVDRLLRAPRSVTRSKKRRRIEPGGSGPYRRLDEASRGERRLITTLTGDRVKTVRITARSAGHPVRKRVWSATVASWLS